MINKIFKQIWNQRRSNVWIFLELIIAGFFLWTVIDPVYIFTTYGLDDKGYNEEGRYVVRFGGYARGHGMRDTTVTREQQKEAFFSMVQLVRNQPEVEAYYIPLSNSFPNAPGWSGGQFFPDTLMAKEGNYVHSQLYSVITREGSDFFQTLGIKDALTGDEIRMPKDVDVRKLCFISETLANRLFGTAQVIGKKVYTSEVRFLEIGGVFKDFKTNDYESTYPLCIEFGDDFPYWGDYAHTASFIVFKLKEGVDFDAFNERFKKEVAPHMNRANLYFKKFTQFGDYRKSLGEARGIYSNLRLKFSLAAFTLLCIFFGMVGTFWIRCNARRQEIGLMRSLGAPKSKVIKQFLVEAAILLTVAYAFSLLIVFNVLVVPEAMSKPVTYGEPLYAIISKWQTPGVQFAMVSIATYLALLVIALIGTLIPVKRAIEILPADALRDE